MDMTEMEDKRVEDFLQKFRTDVPDQGFTRRVMRHLPGANPWNRWGTGLMWAVFILIFWAVDGFRALAHIVLKTLTDWGYACIEQFSWSSVVPVVVLMAGLVWYYGFYAED
jgi:hypothetical protein